MPGIRVAIFVRRGEGTGNSDFFGAGIPFAGHIDIGCARRICGPRGLLAHAFRRKNGASPGGFGYTLSGNWLGGLPWTRDLGADYAEWGISALGEDSAGQTRRLSVEADRYFCSRSELAALTVFPFKEPILRATLELTQRRGDRSLALVARGLFSNPNLL